MESKKTVLEKIDIQIQRSCVEGSPWRTSFGVQIDLGTGLTKRERVILFNSARRCEVYKLLNGELRFEYRLSGRQAGGDGWPTIQPPDWSLAKPISDADLRRGSAQIAIQVSSEDLAGLGPRQAETRFVQQTGFLGDSIPSAAMNRPVLAQFVPSPWRGDEPLPTVLPAPRSVTI